MNTNQIVNMVFRLFFRRAMNFGITRGINSLSGVGRKETPAAAGDPADRDAVAADRQQQRQAKKTAQQARKAARLMRRL